MLVLLQVAYLNALPVDDAVLADLKMNDSVPEGFTKIGDMMIEVFWNNINCCRKINIYLKQTPKGKSTAMSARTPIWTNRILVFEFSPQFSKLFYSVDFTIFFGKKFFQNQF